MGTYSNHGSYSNKYFICLYPLSGIITRKFSLFFFGSVDTLLTIPLAQLVKLEIKVGGIIHDVPLHNHISPHYIFASLLHLNPTLFRINIRKFHSAIIIGCLTTGMIFTSTYM